MIKRLTSKSNNKEKQKFSELFARILLSEFDYYSDPVKQKIINKWQGQELEKKLQNPNYFFLIYYDKNEPVGFYVGKINKHNVGFGRWLGVVKEHQGKGIGSKLKLEFEKIAIDKGVKSLRASTYKKGNFKFLESLGFEFYKQKKGQGIDKPRYVFLKKIA